MALERRLADLEFSPGCEVPTSNVSLLIRSVFRRRLKLKCLCILRIVQTDGIVTATTFQDVCFLGDLPFPRELSMGQQAAREKVVDAGFGALSALLRGGDPVRHVENVASEEADMRIASLKHRYVEWWDRHYPDLQDATLKLQDKLTQALLDLRSEAYTD